jgi:hypothetical protein
MDQQFMNQNTCIKVDSTNPSTLEFRQSASQAVDVKVMVVSLQYSLFTFDKPSFSYVSALHLI